MSLITPDSFVTAESIAEKVKSGEWSAVEILDKYLSQIEQHESEVHAFNTVLEDEARTAARETDKRVAAGETLGASRSSSCGQRQLMHQGDTNNS